MTFRLSHWLEKYRDSDKQHVAYAEVTRDRLLTALHGIPKEVAYTAMAMVAREYGLTGDNGIKGELNSLVAECEAMRMICADDAAVIGSGSGWGRE